MTFARRWSLVAALGATASVAGCDMGPADRTVVIAASGDGDVLIPLLWTQTAARMYTELMFDKLAVLGPDQRTVGDASYAPRLAMRWSWAPDSLSIAFHLDPRARWHDGQPVTAADVRFAFQVYTDPTVAANSGAELARLVDSVTALDPLTAVVWYRRRTPEQFHTVVYNLVPLPAHRLAPLRRDSLRTSAFATQPLGNGPFRFVSWEKTQRLELAANESYAGGRPQLDRVVIAILNPQAAARAVLAGDVDFYERFTLDDVAEAARNPEVEVVPARQYAYTVLEFNLRTPDGRASHPVLGTTGVRRALTMAVNRAALVRNVLGSLGVPGIGPFARAQWTADTTLRQIAYDTVGANRLLDSLGWTRGAGGRRARGGQALAFTVTVSASSRVAMRYAELLQQEFARVGAAVSIEPGDQKALTDRLTGHTFDAVIVNWTTTPSPGGVRQTWGSAAYAKGSPFNAGGWSNAAFDAHVDTALGAATASAMRAHFVAAYQAAIDDAPAIWLYEPMLVIGKNRRVVTGPLPPDAWWMSVPAWTVTRPRRAPAGAADSAR